MKLFKSPLGAILCTSLFLCQYLVYVQADECKAPLGMDEGSIPDDAISASSQWDSNHGPSNARLYRLKIGQKSGAWCSKENDKSQWIQVDLREMFKVTKIATQGRQDSAQWVTQYKVPYSNGGVHFNFQNKVYQASNDQNTVVLNTLDAPIEARFIRVHPQQWHGHISMRMELYGCSLKTDSIPPYETIGCFKDHANHAVPTIEGQDSILDGSYKARRNAIEKCYRAAKKRGFRVFAVQDGGWCATSASAAKTFRKYGKSTACRSDGKGGPWANQVYYIKGL
ncbi:retinoschisin-like [Oculina patagonica]